jgi:hypothetical protein
VLRINLTQTIHKGGFMKTNSANKMKRQSKIRHWAIGAALISGLGLFNPPPRALATSGQAQLPAGMVGNWSYEGSACQDGQRVVSELDKLVISGQLALNHEGLSWDSVALIITTEFANGTPVRETKESVIQRSHCRVTTLSSGDQTAQVKVNCFNVTLDMEENLKSTELSEARLALELRDNGQSLLMTNLNPPESSERICPDQQVPSILFRRL